MNLSSIDLADKIYACWAGKAVGGTIGMPYEGCPGPIELPPPASPDVMVANDDLDLQLLWVWIMEEHGSSVRSRHLAQAAAEHYACYPDEYGVARWNTARGLLPPVTGQLNNAFENGMGAAIRSEIWACVAPGRPELAAALAREDALMDHAGDGVEAARFLAAFESALFTSSDLQSALRTALDLLPEVSKLRQALDQICMLYVEGRSAETAQKYTQRHYGSANFTDVVMNLSFILVGLLWGKGDPLQSIFLAVSCGADTDCTGATCGAILGLLHGTEGLPEAWRKVIQAPLVMDPSLRELPLPQSIKELTLRTLKLQQTWSLHEGERLESPTATLGELPDDIHQWLVLKPSASALSDGGEDLWSQAVQDPASFHKYRYTASGIHLKFQELGFHPGEVVDLLTWIEPGCVGATRLMCCADSGIMAWMDGKLLVNDHSRLPRIPAFHRTVGGATVPVDMVEGERHLLHVRLWIGVVGDGGVTVAVGHEDGRYVHPVSFTIPG
ncbi:ADP-ribosylglycohydrolase family protein [Kiritimatiellota bacterium B12222]|nr:ADP-ribosylglycohydrolase family protein [Kiritimatiellota bacterium B12222]